MVTQPNTARPGSRAAPQRTAAPRQPAPEQQQYDEAQSWEGVEEQQEEQQAPIGHPNDVPVVVDLDQVDENAVTFRVWETGDYPARVENIEYGRSKAGNQMLTWTFQMEDPATGDTRRIKDYTVISADRLPDLKQRLLTVAPGRTMAGTNLQELGAELKGARCTLRIGTEPYDNKTKNVIKRVLPPEDDNPLGYLS